MQQQHANVYRDLLEGGVKLKMFLTCSLSSPFLSLNLIDNLKIGILG